MHVRDAARWARRATVRAYNALLAIPRRIAYRIAEPSIERERTNAELRAARRDREARARELRELQVQALDAEARSRGAQ